MSAECLVTHLIEIFGSQLFSLAEYASLALVYVFEKSFQIETTKFCLPFAKIRFNKVFFKGFFRFKKELVKIEHNKVLV